MLLPYYWWIEDEYITPGKYQLSWVSYRFFISYLFMCDCSHFPLLFCRDGVLEDWPRPRGRLGDKILWHWPWHRPCCPRTHPWSTSVQSCVHSSIRLTSYQFTLVVHNASSVCNVAMFYWVKDIQSSVILFRPCIAIHRSNKYSSCRHWSE